MRKGLRIVLWVVAGIFFLLFAVVIFINTRPGKDFVRTRIVSFLHTKLGTEVQIGELDYDLPTMVVLKDVLLKDQAKDTLLAARQLKVDIALLKLMSSNVSIQQVYLDGAYVHVYRKQEDTAFNFQYIVNAFSPTDTTTPTDTSTLQMNLDKLVLHDVHIKMDDYAGGTRMAYDVGDLNLTMKELDPYKLNFRADKLYANNVRAVLIQGRSYLPAKPDTGSTPVTPNLSANELNLNNVYYDQQNLENQFFMEMNVGQLLAHPKNIDIPGQQIDIRDFLLSNASVNILMKERSAELAKEIADTLVDENAPESVKWRVTANDLNLNNIGFVMNNENDPHMARGIDYSHLDVQKLTLDADNVLYTMDTIGGVINHLAATEQSGLDVRELKTRFEYNPQGGYLNDLYLQTSNSILQDNASVKYPSVEAIAKNPGLIQTEIHFQNSIIGMRDVLIFAPQLYSQPFFRQHQNGMVRLNADITGRLDALDINRLAASGLGNTDVNLSGQVYGIPDPNKLSYNLNIQKLQSTRNDIQMLLPPAALKQIRLPERFGVAGTISGNTTVYHPNLMIVSSDGNAYVKGTVDVSRTGHERYDLVVRTQGLNIGSILQNDQLGIVTADITARGTGFDINSMNVAAKGTIHAATYNHYTYHDVHFNGTVAGKKADFHVNSDDPNAHLNLEGSADFAGKYPAIYTNGTIDSIDLHALHFYSSEMRIHGIVNASIAELNPDYPRGTITIDNPIVTTNGKRYQMDSLYVVASPSADSGNNIIVYAPSLNAHVWGHTPLTRIGDIIQSKINEHYAITDSLKLVHKKKITPIAVPPDYDLHLTARVENNPLLQAFVPGIKDMDTVSVDGLLTPQKLYFDAHAPHIAYQNYNIDDAKILVNGSDSALTYTASVDHLYQKSIDVWYANVSGQLSANEITSRISIADKDSNERFRVNALLAQNNNEQVLQLQPGLMLNYQTWNVNQPNRVVFSDKGFYVENFAISNGQERIAVNSQSPTFNAPLRADISNFLLSDITQIISKDTLIANGVLGGTINLQRFNPDPMVTSTLGISSFSVLGDTIGNVDINVSSATEKAINASVGITGHGNNISLKGLYYPQPVNGSNFDMTLALNPLNVASFEGVAQHQINNSTGFILGSLHVTGTMSDPNLNGTLKTDNLSTTVSMLNTRFTMPNEPIVVNGKNVTLNDFDIQDSGGNVATLNGNFNFDKMDLAMRLRANHWLAMNSTARNNKDFYGRLLLSTNMNIRGPVMAPTVDGSLNILDGTSVTATIPTTQATAQEREGVVKFIDVSDPGSQDILPPMTPDSVRKMASVPAGTNVNLNVTVDDQAEFSVIIDEGSGDFVKIRGEGNLNTTVAPDGTLGLVGTYTILDGSYHLNYNFIQRLFTIQSGSTITFSGDPTMAELNVTAIYEADVPPYDLVSRQIQDPGELVYFKQRLPFQVQMNLTGPMMHPVIGFDIVLPEDQNYRVAGTVTDVVRARLSQLRNNPSDLNKQVFALIILNRFVAEDPFQNGAGSGGVEAIARQSASRFISEQLNKFASGLISGVDLTLDLNTTEDYTTGEKRNRTDLTVGASKRLLNDRLTVDVGTDFQLEGPTSNTKNTSYIPGNIAVTYDLTADGRYRIRFYRKDEETGVVEGNVVATGASFILQKDYNRFRQVFMSKRKRLRQRQDRKQQRADKRQQGQQQQQDNSADTTKAAMILREEENTSR